MGKTAHRALWRYLLARRSNILQHLWLTEEKRPITIDGVQSMVEDMVALAGIKRPHTGPHTFRHTFALKFLENGGSPMALQVLLGHSTLAMTQRYLRTLEHSKVVTGARQYSPVDGMGLK